MLSNLGGWHMLVILAVVLLIFGATRLPALAKSVGQSVSILRRETRTPPVHDGPASPSSSHANPGQGPVTSSKPEPADVTEHQ